MAEAAIACYKLLSVIIGEFFSYGNVLISKQANVSKLAIFALYQNQSGAEIWGTTSVIDIAGHISRSCGINQVFNSPYSPNSFPINLGATYPGWLRRGALGARGLLREQRRRDSESTAKTPNPNKSRRS